MMPSGRAVAQPELLMLFSAQCRSAPHPRARRCITQQQLARWPARSL